MRAPTRFTLLLLGSLCASSALWGDTVVLVNGDRLSGDIQEMTQRRLTIETDYSPSIEIEWRAVRSVSSDRPFTVWLADGNRRVGRLSASTDGIELVDRDGDRERLYAGDVLRLFPVGDEGGEDDFWEFWDGDIDAGLSLTRGNTSLSQLYLGVDLIYRRASYDLQIDASSLASEQLDDEPDAVSRQTASAQLDLFLGDRAFLFGLTRLERDIRQRLDVRASFGGGLGWHLLRSANAELALLGGATWSGERFRTIAGVSGEDASIEGLLGFDLDTDWIPGVELTSRLTYYPTLFSSRYRLVFDNNLRVPLTRRFTWGLLLYDRYDSRPPAGVQNNDIGLVGTFGFGF